MFLSHGLLRWAISELHEVCHPFVGITFLASKKASMPVGKAREMSLDALTRDHLSVHHRLDPQSEFYFQPFKSNKSSQYWVSAKYPSSGLQAINTQTFRQVFVHPSRTRQWGLVERYAEVIANRVEESSGHSPPSIAAMAIWLGKTMEWAEAVNIETIIARFRSDYHLTAAERDLLFDTDTMPPSTLPLAADEQVDLRMLAHSFENPPDGPEQTEGTLSSIRLLHVGPAEQLDLEFGSRLTLIAGDNGLGKSFLLDAAWWAITTTWAAHEAFPLLASEPTQPRISYGIINDRGAHLEGTAKFDWKTRRWNADVDMPSVAALKIYSRVDGSFVIADERRAALSDETGSLASVFRLSAAEVWDGKPKVIEGLVRDWVSWQFGLESGSFELLRRVLEHLSPEEGLTLEPSTPVRIKGDARQIPTIRQIYGDVPILFASAGVQRILLLSYLIIWSWQEHVWASQQIGESPRRRMVIIVDEMEAHLHPKWQRVVLPALMSVGKLMSDELRVQVIAATHSPLVLASVENEFSPESDVLAHLSVEDDAVHLEQVDFYKYGDMSSWLTSPIFGLSHARSKAAERVIEDAKAVQLAEETPLAEVKRTTERLKRVLAPDDPFWSRWIFFAKTRGDDI